MRALTDNDRRAILSVADALVMRAGRTTLVMALRGSRAKRVLQYPVERAKGYGAYAGVPEPEVMANVDALIAQGIFRREYVDGYPLIAYTARGLQMAERFVAEEWLEAVRAQVGPVATGSTLELPFLMSVEPQRNHDTVFKVIRLVGSQADASWLPMLRAWSAAETRRARARLAPIIARLEHDVAAGPAGKTLPRDRATGGP